jgi:hypothetical protein
LSILDCPSGFVQNHRGNQEWKIKRQWQHWAHKTQYQHKTTGAIKNGQSRDNGNCPFLIAPVVLCWSCLLCAQCCHCLLIVHSRDRTNTKPQG